MSSFRSLNISHSYNGKGSRILNDFLLPVLEESISYDRITSFYTVDSLLAISQGIDSLYSKKGRMRLIIGVHSFPSEMAEAELRRKHLSGEIDRVRQAVTTGLASIEDELVKRRVATLAWMMEDGLLEVRVASVEGEGLFHPKTLIFQDTEGNEIAAVGSSNETSSGLGGNYEQLMVATSWDTADAVADQESFFESLWTNDSDDAIVSELTEELAEAITQGIGAEYVKSQKPSKVATKPTEGILAEAAEMPANFFVSGHIPSLFQHQERAVLDALSRWPVRVLFADEVGLGKTFEVAATIAYLMRYGGVRRVTILTPKAVLKQWQEELSEHFGMEAWLYDSTAKQYVSPTGKTISMGATNPLGKGSPNITLISAQLARGGRGKKDIFQRSGAILPDLLALDEAHSARVRKDISGSTKSTKMYNIMEAVAPKIPHVILATATPMQTDAGEYHSMLKLLGLPKAWQKQRSYELSLKLIASDYTPSANDAYHAGKLLRSTLTIMKPSLNALSDAEKDVIQQVMDLGPDADSYDLASLVQSNWKAFRQVFVKLHPANLLTVRNTRRSLENIGYVLPKRNLIEESIDNSAEIQLFYAMVDKYLTTYCFSVEKALYPDRKLNIGFIRTNYRQRVASSLHSCKKSLVRRMQKMEAYKRYLEKNNKSIQKYSKDFTLENEIDELEDDELLMQGIDSGELKKLTEEKIDLDDLDRALDLEITSITPLIKLANKLLQKYGDMKIDRSIAVALKHLKKGDKVLLFSRYTDTVEALVEDYQSIPESEGCAFGIYTGQKSVTICDDREIPCTKEQIKRKLQTGEIKMMFCSDAASEGLNLQAARVLINVDVPWTPSRLEQRIGRIARLGQVADEVDIHNVWYPHSIEARMYTRIQQRLKDSNLAIGEFPDVVADGIKDAILEDRDDDGLDKLQEIRNSNQTKALEELWSSRAVEKTTSGVIRDGLMEICENELPHEYDEEMDLTVFEVPDGSTFEATSKDGADESISYCVLIDHGIDFEMDSLSTIIGADSKPSAFTLHDDGRSYLDHEDIPGLLLGKQVEAEMPIDTWPKMVPNPAGLSISYALEVESPEAIAKSHKGDDVTGINSATSEKAKKSAPAKPLPIKPELWIEADDSRK